jgi:hypothetical protein
MVVTAPVDTTIARSRPKLLSATKTLPSVSTATPLGLQNEAALPTPLALPQ